MTGRRGIAQLLVLWALVLLGTLALAFSLSMRTEAQAARNGVDDARAYFLARTGVARAAVLLATLSVDNVMAAAIAGRDGDASYEVRVESESGKVDINLVTEEVLLEILRKGGLPDEEAESVRDAILDWRDEDDTPGPGGGTPGVRADARAGEAAQREDPAASRNWRYVKGVTPEFHRAFLSRVFTANGNSAQRELPAGAGDRPAVAPRSSAEAAEQIVARRAEDPPMTAADLAAMVGEGLLTSQGLALISGGPASSAT